jgi:hypothetical protein
MAKAKATKPMPPKPEPIMEQEPEIKTNGEKVFEFLRTKLVFFGTIAAAIVSIFTLATSWDRFHLPRLAFNSEMIIVRKQVYSLEIEFRQRAKRNDARAIYEIDDKINELKAISRPVPDIIYQQRDRLVDDMKDTQEKLDRAIKNLNE